MQTQTIGLFAKSDRLSAFARTILYIVSGERAEVIGEDTGPINGYARSVYYLVTGEKIEMDLPDINIDLRSSASSSVDDEIRIFPNPARNILQIDAVGTGYEDLTIRLVNPDGAELYAASMTANELLQINTNDIPPGMYAVSYTHLTLPTKA